MKYNLILQLFWGLCLVSSITSAASFDDLDFDKAIDNGDILFAPFKGDTRGRGYVWFRNYFYKYNQPSNSQIRTVTVTFYPSNYENGEFTAFANAHGLRPRNDYLLPDDAVLCDKTPALEQLLDTFSYKETSKLGDAFPRLCSLRIKYSATDEQEQALFDLIESGELMDVKVEIFSSNPSPSIVVDVPTIVSNLEYAGILSPYFNAANPSTQIGKQADEQALSFFSSRQDNALYGLTNGDGEEAVFEIWKKYISLFNPVPDTDSQVFIRQEDTEKLLEITAPDTPSDPILVIDY